MSELNTRSCVAFASTIIISTCALVYHVSVARAEPERVARIVIQDQWENRIKSANGRIMDQFRDSGIVLGEAGDPMHESFQTCFGTYATVDKDKERAVGYCDGLDADGDVYWLTWEGGRTEGPWKFVGGTGKFAGLTGGGEWKDRRMPGKGWLVRTITGKWTLPKR